MVFIFVVGKVIFFIKFYFFVMLWDLLLICGGFVLGYRICLVFGVEVGLEEIVGWGGDDCFRFGVICF